GRREIRLAGAAGPAFHPRLAPEPAPERARHDDVLQMDVEDALAETRERPGRSLPGGDEVARVERDADERGRRREPLDEVLGAGEVGVPVILDREADSRPPAGRVDDGDGAPVDHAGDEVDAERLREGERRREPRLDGRDAGAEEAAGGVRPDRDADVLRRAADGRRLTGAPGVIR